MNKKITRLIYAGLFVVAATFIFWLDLKNEISSGVSLLYILLCAFNFKLREKRASILIAAAIISFITASWVIKAPHELATNEVIHKIASIIGVLTFSLYFRLEFHFRNEKRANIDSFKRNWQKRFYSITAFAFIKLILLAVVIYNLIGSYQVERQVSVEQKKMHRLELERIDELNSALADLLLISNLQDTKNFLENIPTLEKDFLRTIRMRPNYDQIRILDLDGSEIIRVNGGKNAHIVAKDKLQNKASRDYYQNTLLLTERQVLTSPINFNMENGKVELPKKAVLRISKPIFSNRKTAGVLAINYLIANHTSPSSSKGKTQNKGELFVLSNSGTLLNQPTGSNSQDTIGENFQKTKSKLWKAIQADGLGHVEVDGHYYVFEHMPIRTVIGDNSNSKVVQNSQQNEGLFILRKIPEQVIKAAYHNHFSMFLSILLVAFFLFVTIIRHLYNQMKREELSWIRFQSVFNNTHEFIGLLTPDGTLLEANDTALKFGGFTREQAVGQKFWNARWWSLSEKTKTELIEAIKLAATGTFVRYDVDVIGVENQIITIDFTLRPVFNSENEVIYIIPEGTDVTEKNKLQNELIRTNEIFTNIQQLAKVGAWSVDTKEMKAYWDKQVYAIHEVPEGTEISVDEGIKFYHPDYQELVQNTITESIENNTSWDLEAILITQSGKEVWVRAIGYPVIEEGELVGLRGMFMDITARVQKDQKIQSLNQVLEKKVEERTKKLAVANKKLDSANQELEAFSYSVSHDLKAPLRALQGFSKNLSSKYSDVLDETGVRWLKFISDNAQAMDDLIQDMLNFSKMNKKELQKVEVDMFKIVENQIEKLKMVYPIETKIIIGELPPATCDRAMMETVWQNLIGNAFKYSHKNDTIEIEISAFSDEKYTHYFIKDKGVGFDMRFSDKLFGVFQRLHHSNDFEGTGVGLANVHRIIAKHEGTISAESKVNEGATFTFTLPKINR